MVDEEDGVFTLDTVPYPLRQPSKVVGGGCGPGVFIGSAYKLCVPFGFSCDGVKYPLEGYGARPYGLHCMVGLCAWAQRVTVGWVACGGSTLCGGSGGGLGGLFVGTAGGTLGGAWGLVLCCRLGIYTVAHVYLVDGVGLRGGARVVAKILASLQMAYMIWVPKQAKGAAGAGFARA